MGRVWPRRRGSLGSAWRQSQDERELTTERWWTLDAPGCCTLCGVVLARVFLVELERFWSGARTGFCERLRRGDSSEWYGLEQCITQRTTKRTNLCQCEMG